VLIKYVLLFFITEEIATFDATPLISQKTRKKVKWIYSRSESDIISWLFKECVSKKF
jgi:hypothetical protein